MRAHIPCIIPSFVISRCLSIPVYGASLRRSVASAMQYSRRICVETCCTCRSFVLACRMNNLLPRRRSAASLRRTNARRPVGMEYLTSPTASCLVGQFPAVMRTLATGDRVFDRLRPSPTSSRLSLRLDGTRSPAVCRSVPSSVCLYVCSFACVSVSRPADVTCARRTGAL